MEDVLGRGVHGLPALDDLVDAKIAEHAREPFARAHGDAAVALFGRGRAIRLRRGLAFQLLFHGLEIVGRPGLAPGGQIVVLQAHVLDLRQLQRPILLGLAQRVARNVRMYVDLEGLVILADDETVADAAEILAQRVERGDILALADDKDRVEGKGDVLRVKNAEISLFVRRARVLADNVVAAQALEHAAQDQAEAHAARVDDAGLFEDGVLVDGIVERGVRGVQAVLEHVFDLAVFLGEVARGVRRQAGDGQDGALGGLHDGLVGGLDARSQRGGKVAAVGLELALERLGKAAEQQGQDDARVASGPAQKRGSGHIGGLGKRHVLCAAQLGAGGVQRHAHVRAGVAVGDGEDVQLVDLLLIQVDLGSGGEHHPGKYRAVNGFDHGGLPP